jgi:hypothetical protein
LCRNIDLISWVGRRSLSRPAFESSRDQELCRGEQ